MTDLYRVPAFCPVCGRKAAIKAFRGQVLVSRNMPPDEPMVSVPCPGSKCATFFPVTASEFARAVLERKAA